MGAFSYIRSKGHQNGCERTYTYFELAISFLTITAEATMKAMIRPSSIGSTYLVTVKWSKI